MKTLDNANKNRLPTKKKSSARRTKTKKTSSGSKGMAGFGSFAGGGNIDPYRSPEEVLSQFAQDRGEHMANSNHDKWLMAAQIVGSLLGSGMSNYSGSNPTEGFEFDIKANSPETMLAANGGIVDGDPPDTKKVQSYINKNYLDSMTMATFGQPFGGGSPNLFKTPTNIEEEVEQYREGSGYLKTLFTEKLRQGNKLSKKEESVARSLNIPLHHFKELYPEEYNKVMEKTMEDIKMCGGGKVKKKALGGTVPVEVEGEEIGKLPSGFDVKFKGPSHGQGGIDTNLPPGTEIFSKRIKVKDPKTGKKVSMADREEARIKTENKLKRRLKVNPVDKITKTTLKRTEVGNELAREKDMSYQELVNAVNEFGTQMYAGGGKVKDFFTNLVGEDGESAQYNFGKSFGNALSLIGNMYGASQNLQLAKQSYSNRIPNIDPLKDYGEDALNLYDEALGMLSGQKEQALKGVERKRKSDSAINRRSIRGINTMRALDTQSQAQANQLSAGIETQFSNLISQMLTKKATLTTDIDKTRGAGEFRKHTADQQDLANFLTQMGAAQTGMGTAFQQTGKDINAMTSNNFEEELMNFLSRYGWKFENGELVKVAGEGTGLGTIQNNKTEE